MKKLKRILLISWLVVIFYMSAMPSSDSLSTSNVVGEFIYKFYLLFVPRQNALDLIRFLEINIPVIRKLAHFTEFAILGKLFYTNLDTYQYRKRIILSIVFSVIYAISDEIHQLFVLNRHCSVYDMLIDSLGAITGILLFHLIVIIWKKHYVSS